MSDEGKRTDFDSAKEITLKEITFNYPSRQDIQVSHRLLENVHI